MSEIETQSASALAGLNPQTLLEWEGRKLKYRVPFQELKILKRNLVPRLWPLSSFYRQNKSTVIYYSFYFKAQCFNQRPVSLFSETIRSGIQDYGRSRF